jgi:hypothetical protein
MPCSDGFRVHLQLKISAVRFARVAKALEKRATSYALAPLGWLNADPAEQVSIRRDRREDSAQLPHPRRNRASFDRATAFEN